MGIHFSQSPRFAKLRSTCADTESAPKTCILFATHGQEKGRNFLLPITCVWELD